MQSHEHSESEILVLGSLLCHIDRLLIRAGIPNEPVNGNENVISWFRQWLEPWLPEPAILIAQRIPFDELAGPLKRLALIRSWAEQFAKGYVSEVAENPSDSQLIPLRSIFSEVNFPGSESAETKPAEDLFLAPEIIGDLPSIPRPFAEVKMGAKAYQIIRDRFEKDLSIWLKSEQSIDSLLLLLEKHWSTIPADVNGTNKNDLSTYPVISLFDHCKVVASLALVFFHFLNEKGNEVLEADILNNMPNQRKSELWKNQAFLLIGGGFSGIQDFIYTISSKGALKGLRLRSFFMELLTEHLVHEILHALGLTRANVIYSGGGHFYLLAQNTEKSIEILEDFHADVNRWMLGEFGQRLYLGLAMQALSGLQIGGFSGVENDEKLLKEDFARIWAALTESLERQKQNKWAENIEQILQPVEPLHVTERCAVCQRDDKPLSLFHENNEEMWMCGFCSSLRDCSQHFHSAAAITAHVLNEGQQGAIVFPGYKSTWVSYDFADGNTAGKEDFVWILNSFDLANYRFHRQLPLIMSKYVRRVDQLPEEVQKKALAQDRSLQSAATFEDLSAASRGANRLGILRMDVDRLGATFYYALQPRKRTSALTRMASLSRQLSIFFKWNINTICAGHMPSPLKPMDKSLKNPGADNHGRNVTLVYSGGDDLFLVGAWDEIIEVAFDIRMCFQQHTGNHLSLSAGIIIESENVPIHLLADNAAMAEKLAKSNRETRLGGDSFTLFQQTFTWSEAESVFEIVDLLLALCKSPQEIHKNCFQPKFSHGFIYKLLAIEEMFSEFHNRREGMLYLPKAAYLFGSLRNEMKKMPIEEQKKVGELQAVVMEINKMGYLRAALHWVELLLRS